MMKKYILGAFAMTLLCGIPASAKQTIGPFELSCEFINVIEVVQQIEKMEEILEFKETVCSVLGADMCNAISNQIAACTKGALKKLNKEIIDVDKQSLINAATSCAGNLYISDCIDAGYDALNDIQRKMTNTGKILNRLQKSDERFYQDADRAYTSFLTGETFTERARSAEKSLQVTKSLYRDLGAGSVSKSYFGNSVRKLFNNATTSTRNIELVKACSMDALSAVDWLPSMTTLSSGDMAPSVPAKIGAILTGADQKKDDLISKLANGGNQLADGIDNALSGFTGLFEQGIDGAETIKDEYHDVLSLYNRGEKALNRLDKADDIGSTIKGAKDVINVAQDAEKKVGMDPFLTGKDDFSKPFVDAAREKLESGWNVVEQSAVGQTVGDAAKGVKGEIEKGSAAMAAGVSAVDDKVTAIEQELSALVFAGMKKTTDAVAGAAVGGVIKAADWATGADDARKNQNQLQINALSGGIGNGLKGSALVRASGEEVQERGEKIKMSPTILNMLKEIAALSAQSLQKNNNITSMKSQLLEMGSFSNIVKTGIINALEIGG